MPKRKRDSEGTALPAIGFIDAMRDRPYTTAAVAAGAAAAGALPMVKAEPA